MNDSEKARTSGDASRPAESSHTLPTVNAPPMTKDVTQPSLHPAFYVVSWIAMSSGVILFNKWVLDTKDFRFPIILTTWHLAFASLMTQILARTTTLLDSRRNVKMTGRVYLRAIVPIGFFFSLSLICGNKAYLYLSVAFIQMLKATTPVAVLLATWALGVAPPNLKTLGNVSFIVIGVILATFGEIMFDLTGFIYQVTGVMFEATRLVMIQMILSSPDFKMDPLVSLYYYAPVCAVMNGVVSIFTELPDLQIDDIYRVGILTLIANATIAFLLNVSLVFLIGKTSSLVLTLCGVLKDILLVMASMIIWGTPVSSLQFFGYAVALGGLLYYKLGREQLKQYAGATGRSWSEFGSERPVARKLAILGGAILTFFLMVGVLTPSDTVKEIPKYWRGVLGGVMATGMPNPKGVGSG